MGKDEQLERFEKYLRKENMADNTIAAYIWTVNYFYSKYGALNKNNVLLYKEYLLSHFKPATINVRIQAINKFCIYMKRRDLQLKHVKVQSKPYVDKVISNADYKYLKKRLKQEENKKWYYIVWLMCATGARVGETVRFKVEDIITGYMDIYSKGGKLRRIYIPVRLQKELLCWLQEEDVSSGFIFKNKNGIQISTRGIEKQLKGYARKYGLDEREVFPHSFRHRFAINFLEKKKDLALLADILGHSNIETTRIYLRMTAAEQIKIINEIVTW